MDDKNSDLTYDTILELAVKNMGEFVGHTKSCTHINRNTLSILQALKESLNADTLLNEQQKTDIGLQADEAISRLADSQDNLMSNIDCLKGQLESFREIHQALKSSGSVSGDISSGLNFVERALAPKDE